MRENLYCHLFGEYIRINIYPFFVAVSAFLLSSLLGVCFVFFLLEEREDTRDNTKGHVMRRVSPVKTEYSALRLPMDRSVV